MKIILALLFALLFIHASSQQIDVQHYSFDIELSEQSDTIKGRATIGMKLLRNADSIMLDLVSPGADGKGMRVLNAYSPGKISYYQKGDKLVVKFNKARTAGQKILLDLWYEGVPADGLIISKNKHGDRTYFADNWPNRAHHWIPCNDRPDDKASVSFRVDVPAGYSVIANGIAVKGPDDITGKRRSFTWIEKTPLPTKVIVFGAARFAVKQYEEKPGGVPVSAWSYPQDSVKVFRDLALGIPALKFFQAYLAPFPFKKLAQVQSTTIFGGMENASAIFYDQDLLTGDGRAEAVIVHEIVHQWFGDMASEKSFAHLWLSEGFATYLTNFYFEKKYGIDSARKRLNTERLQVIRFTSGNKKPVVDTTSALMELLNANSYQKGGWVLHMIRCQAGDGAFQKILKSYYRKYKGANADTRDLQRVVEDVTKKDWSGFFQQWLYLPGVPKVSMQWGWKDGTLELNADQQGMTIMGLAPLTVGYITKSGKRYTAKMDWTSKRMGRSLKVPEEVVAVVIDPEMETLVDGRVEAKR